MQAEKTKTGRAIRAAAVWVIWWPAILLTLFSYYQYAQMFILLPFARGIGLSNSVELSTGQFLYVFSGTMFSAGIVIPLATFLACYFLNPGIMARIVLFLSVLLALLSYASLVSVSNTGTLLTGDLFVEAIVEGVREPELASHYVSVRSATKLLMVLGSIFCAALVVRLINDTEFTPALQKLVGWLLIVSVAILPSAYVYAQLSADTELEPGIDFITQQVVTLLRLEGDTTSAFDGLEIEQAMSVFQRTVNAPEGQNENPYSGRESGSNLILISLESAPQVVVDFQSIARFENLRKLARKSLVANQHYSTYPYTSDALFSVLSSLYPNNLRRHLLTETSLQLDNNLDADRIGLFNALSRSGYFVKVYMSSESVFEADRAMFFKLGANEVFVPDRENVDEQVRKSLVASATTVFPNYETISRTEREALEKRLTDDIATLDQMLSDVRTMASAGKKFSALFLPLVGHGPWPNQVPGKTRLETGTEIFLLQDEWIGRIVRTLEYAGIADNTVIVVTADHGLRTSAEYPDLRPGVLNEITFRVPLIVHAPNAISEPTYIDHVTSHIDIAPTILSLLGIDDSLIYMLGSPIWDDRIANRRTYFLANDYLGVDGYFEREKFYMYRPMTNATMVTDSMYSQRRATLSNDFLSIDTGSGDRNTVASEILFQRSFQGVLKRYLLDSD